MTDLYPLIECYESGLLDVGDGNQVYWEVAGNPHGKPAVVMHGGPGQGCAPGMRRGFDPARYRVVTFDQRGCGKSVPHASDISTDMSVNTTHHLIRDIELLRIHLGIERWLVSGGSWGVTLALAYAEQFSMQVSELVLSSITTCSRTEIDWIYQGLGKEFPEEYERFLAVLTPENRINGFYSAYSKLMASDGPSRIAAAKAWLRWENVILSREPNPPPVAVDRDLTRDDIAFVRICAHYCEHAVWLEEGQIIKDAPRLAGIPGVLIHGSLDLTCRAEIARDLAAAWPNAKLVLLDDAGHLATPSRRSQLVAALDGFAL